MASMRSIDELVAAHGTSAQKTALARDRAAFVAAHGDSLRERVARQEREEEQLATVEAAKRARNKELRAQERSDELAAAQRRQKVASCQGNVSDPNVRSASLWKRLGGGFWYLGERNMPPPNMSIYDSDALWAAFGADPPACLETFYKLDWQIVCDIFTLFTKHVQDAESFPCIPESTTPLPLVELTDSLEREFSPQLRAGPSSGEASVSFPAVRAHLQVPPYR